MPDRLPRTRSGLFSWSNKRLTSSDRWNDADLVLGSVPHFDAIWVILNGEESRIGEVKRKNSLSRQRLVGCGQDFHWANSDWVEAFEALGLEKAHVDEFRVMPHLGSFLRKFAFCFEKRRRTGGGEVAVARAVKLKAKNGARLSTLVPCFAMADGELKRSLLRLVVQIAGEFGFDFFDAGEAALEFRR